MKTIPPVPEKRRARRLPSRAARMTALCVVVCAALAAVLLLRMDAPDEAQSALPSAAPDTRETLANYSQDDIVRMEIAPGGSAPYALARGEDGAFLLEGDASFVLDAWLVEDMLSACDVIRLEPVMTIGGTDETSADLPSKADFGLTDDSLRVAVQYADGTRLTLLFGMRLAYLTPERVYVLCDDVIYLAYTSALFEPLNRPRASLRSVPQIDIPSESLCGLEYARENDTFALEKTGEGWMIASPVSYPADAQTVQAALAAVLALRVMPPPDDVPKFSPEATLTLDGAADVRYLNEAGLFSQTDAPARAVLELGQVLPGGDRLARLDGVPVTLASSSLAFLDVLTARALAARTPLTADAQSITRLEIAAPDAVNVYEITKTERVLPNNAFETDEQGAIVYDTAVTANGAPCALSDFEAVYAEVAALCATGILPDGWRPAPGDAPLKSITVITAQGAHTLELYAFDALHAAMWLDGAGLFITPRPIE